MFVCVCVGTLTFQVHLLIALQETIHHPVKWCGGSHVLFQLKQKPLWHNSAVKQLVVFWSKLDIEVGDLGPKDFSLCRPRRIFHWSLRGGNEDRQLVAPLARGDGLRFENTLFEQDETLILQEVVKQMWNLQIQNPADDVLGKCLQQLLLWAGSWARWSQEICAKVNDSRKCSC